MRAIGKAGTHQRDEDKQRKLLERATLALWLYLIFDYVRPQNYIPGMDLLRPGLLLTLLSIYFWYRQPDKQALQHKLFKGYRWLLIFSIMGLAWCVNHYWVVEYTKTLLIFMFAGALPIALVLSDKTRIRKFLYGWVTLQTVIALVCIVKKGVGPGGALADENDFALCIDMAIPYAIFLIFSNVTAKREKLLLSGAALIMILAVGATLSRGGMVGCAAMLMTVVWFGKSRFKIALVLAFLMVAAVPFLPPTLFKEAASIDNKDDKTAKDRFRSWQMGWMMFADAPIQGVGVGNYPWRVLDYEMRMPDYKPGHGNHAGRVAHSLWFTLIPEYGLIGIFIYFWLIVHVFKRCRYIIRRCSAKGNGIEDAELYATFAKAIIASLVAFMAAGTFISVLYYPHFWYLIGFCVGLDIAYQRGTGDLEVKLRKSFGKTVKAT